MAKKSTPFTGPKPDATAKLEAQIDELTRGWQRTQADFENFRRKTLEERAALAPSIAAETLVKLVPIYDNFQRAFAHVHDEHATWADGFRQIAHQMEEVFRSHGLERIATIGTVFDPHVHEAVSQLPHHQHPADTVAQEIESGWMLGDRVLKPAKVVVSSGPVSSKGD